MHERWRKPLKVLSHEPSGEAFIDGNGRIQRGVNLVLDDESVQRLREGYACLKCLAVFERAWPLKCPDCGAPIATEQSKFFAEMYAGEEQLGSRLSINDELERLRNGEIREDR
jgi:predicted RNA-binding Zn-ribbon protein involved in translation (DUF1610 family)